MKSIPTHIVERVTHTGKFCYEVSLWILFYEGGILTSWSKDIIDDNYSLMIETGVQGYMTRLTVIVFQRPPFEDLFIRCYNKMNNVSISDSHRKCKL